MNELPEPVFLDGLDRDDVFAQLPQMSPSGPGGKITAANLLGYLLEVSVSFIEAMDRLERSDRTGVTLLAGLHQFCGPTLRALAEMGLDLASETVVVELINSIRYETDT